MYNPIALLSLGLLSLPLVISTPTAPAPALHSHRPKCARTGTATQIDGKTWKVYCHTFATNGQNVYASANNPNYQDYESCFAYCGTFPRNSSVNAAEWYTGDTGDQCNCMSGVSTHGYDRPEEGQPNISYFAYLPGRKNLH